MEVKFDLVRIGLKRKSNLSEMLLKQNVDFLKSSIRHVLCEYISGDVKNEISLVIIVPGKGYNIKIALKYIKDHHIRKILSSNFPYSIYKGKYEVILKNM